MFARTTLSLALVMGCLFFSCKNENARPLATPVSTASAEAPAQPKVVPAAVRSATSSPIGQRTAEEMVAAGFRRYGIEKGVLLFRVDGAMKGMEALYFDHWGWREGKFHLTETEVGAYHKKANTAQYLDGERRYEYSYETNTATWFNSKQVQAAADKYGTLDMVQVADEMIKNMGGRLEGKGKVMDVECDKWKIDAYRSTLHMWNGITLKEESYTGNIPVGRHCVSLETDVEVPLEKMTVPPGAEMKRMD